MELEEAPLQVSVSEAEAKLPELLQAVEEGATVTICREGVPVAEIVQAKPQIPQGPRILGALKDKIVIHDPDWWKPMSDQEAGDFINGKY